MLKNICHVQNIVTLNIKYSIIFALNIFKHCSLLADAPSIEWTISMIGLLCVRLLVSLNKLMQMKSTMTYMSLVPWLRKGTISM